jgi:superfamily I DNA/RNA helicase
MVSLGTMHRAKGLEFKCVFVIDVSDNYLPSASVLSKKTDAQLREDFIEQERQLLYVSITRARDVTFVTWTGTPSRFLGEKE